MRYKLILIFILLLLCTISVHGEIFSVNPCGTSYVYEQGNGAVAELVLENGCFRLVFRKSQYNPNIDFYDKQNDEYFTVHLMGLEERETVSPFRNDTVPFASLGMTIYNTSDTIWYSDGSISFGYTLNHNTIKSFAEIIGYGFVYPYSELWLEVMKRKDIAGSLVFLESEIDGIPQELHLEEQGAGINIFYYQNLGRGYTITLDPLYTVDYSPIPAIHLIDGDADVDDDDVFITSTDITTGVSDDNDSTTYECDDGSPEMAIKGSWNQTYDSVYDWYLRMRKTSLGIKTYYVYAYFNGSMINVSEYVTGTVAVGTGWYNINVSSLMDYMTNQALLDYTSLRFFTTASTYFSEIRLRKEVNDTDYPTIDNCQIDNSSMVTGSFMRLKCNITDDVDVAYVNGTVDGINYTFIMNDTWWYYDYSCLDENSDINWSLVNAWDLSGNQNMTYPYIIFDCNLPPRLSILYPLGHTLDQFHNVPIVIDVNDTSLDFSYATITFPNGTSILQSGFGTGLPSDDFDTDTENINWVHSDNLIGNQSCFTDIDGTVPNKMFISLDGSGTANTLQCAFNSLKLVDEDFDLNLAFNITHFEDDTSFTLRSAPTNSLFAIGVRAFIVIAKVAGNNEYRFGYNNGSGTVVTTIPTSDTYGKLRIKKSNTHLSSPIFNLYYWNNTGLEWIDVVGDINMSDSARLQYIQIKPTSSGDIYGKINLTIDDFEIYSHNHSFIVFNYTSDIGRYNVTVTVNDTTGLTSNETSYFIITEINDPPSRPFFDEPDIGDLVTGLFDIIWGAVIDDENDSLRFNITLLNPDFTFNVTIVSNYGDSSTTSYPWNSSLYDEGVYSMRIVVYENETSDGLSNTETLGGNFTVYIPSEQVFNCMYNDQPFLKNKIPFMNRDLIHWLCWIDKSDANCLTEVWKDGILLQTNPDIRKVETVGLVESFYAGDFPENYFRVWFNKENLLSGETFNFTVRCSANKVYTFSRLVTPSYKDLTVVAYRGVWVKENMGYLIMLLIILAVIIIIWRISTK